MTTTTTTTTTTPPPPPTTTTTRTRTRTTTTTTTSHSQNTVQIPTSYSIYFIEQCPHLLSFWNVCSREICCFIFGAPERTERMIDPGWGLWIVFISTYQVIQVVTFLSPNVGGHQQPLKGPRFHHPKKKPRLESPGIPVYLYLPSIWLCDKPVTFFTEVFSGAPPAVPWRSPSSRWDALLKKLESHVPRPLQYPLSCSSRVVVVVAGAGGCGCCWWWCVVSRSVGMELLATLSLFS